MSTRCNLLVESGETKLFIYHHHDGYLEGVGRDLLDRLKKLLASDVGKWARAHEFVTGLLSDKNEEYEVTVGWHGDIEYSYRIVFGDDGDVSIGWHTSHEARSNFRRDPTPAEMGSVEKFERDIKDAEAQR